MPHSNELFNIPYPELNLTVDNFFFKVHSNNVLPSTTRLAKGLFPIALPVNILKALLLSSILATWPAHLNILDIITLTILG